MRIFLSALLAAIVLTGCPSTPPLPPVASFTATPAGGYSPLTVQFTDLSTPGTSPITARYWNLGDGTTTSDTNPIHTYTRVAKFTVTLRVVTSVSDSIMSKEKFIEVLQPAAGPSAHFTAEPQSGSAPLNVQFTDDSTPGDLPVTTWHWTFGDGDHSTLQNPLHTYTTLGAYTVELTVSNSLGEDSFTQNNLITVLE